MGLPELQFDLPAPRDGRDRQHMEVQAEFGGWGQHAWNGFVLGRWNRDGLEQDRAFQFGIQRRF